VDGAKVGTARELQKEVLHHKIGQAIQLTVWRRGATLRIPVTTAELPEELTRVANTQSPVEQHADAEVWGLKLKDAEGGAQVVAIAPETPAARAEIIEGDIVTAVESQTVSGAVGCVKAIEAAAREKSSKSVLLNLDRKGKRTFSVLKLSP